MMDIKEVLFLWFIIFFDKKPQLAEELHKPITKKLKRRKVYLSFKDNIWSADLADMN